MCVYVDGQAKDTMFSLSQFGLGGGAGNNYIRGQGYREGAVDYKKPIDRFAGYLSSWCWSVGSVGK